MVIKVVPARGAYYTIADFVAVVSDVFFAARLGRHDADSLHATLRSGLTIDATGRGLEYADGQSGPYPADGVLQTITVRGGGHVLGHLTGFNLNIPATVRAVEAEYSGHPAAVDNLLLSRQWNYTGTAAPDVVLPNTRIGNGAIFDLKRDDTINGGGGDDRLYAGHGNDKLLGGIGDDQLIGGAGNDTVAGGRGFDTMAGGVGRDVFVVEPSGRDTIADFHNNEDHIRMVGERWADLYGSVVRGGTLVSGDHTEVLLRGVHLAELDRGDFLF